MTLIRFFLLFTLFCFSLLAQAECKLNQFGFNICTGESAIWEKEANSFTKVKVMQIKYFETVVKDGSEKTTTDINNLVGNVGNRSCQENNKLCKGQKITIKPQCQAKFPEEKYLIKEVYENAMLESQEGTLFSKKVVLIPFDCIEI